MIGEEKLAKELRLKNLYISFNGFWPEMSVSPRTCTFKEFEALVMRALMKGGRRRERMVTPTE